MKLIIIKALHRSQQHPKEIPETSKSLQNLPKTLPKNPHTPSPLHQKKKRWLLSKLAHNNNNSTT